MFAVIGSMVGGRLTDRVVARVGYTESALVTSCAGSLMLILGIVVCSLIFRF